MNRLQTPLSGRWELTFGAQTDDGPNCPADLSALDWQTIPATVPGNVELDLMGAGLLPDLTKGNNVYEALAYEGHEWWYRRTFEVAAIAPGEQIDLVFEGLDCLGTVWLNGRELGHTDNMLIAHRFNVTEHLRANAENELVVRIASAVLAGRRYELDALCQAQPGNYESLPIRKAPHMYGWDIMPRLVSAGIWRDVYLESAGPTRVHDVYWTTMTVDANARRATVRCGWQLCLHNADTTGLTLAIELKHNGSVVHRAEEPVLSQAGVSMIYLQDVSLWWPRGCTGQSTAALYDSTVVLLRNGEELDRRSHRLGLRTTRLERTEVTTDDDPGEFVFIVNGRKIFVHGTNWVPLDALHSRDLQHLRDTLDMAVDLNCNMIRCWGGNVYEDHGFFDYCDEQGIMVWQDFAMACAIYPQDDAFACRLRAEAEAVVAKLRNHPSLVMWAGDNENDDAHNWLFGGTIDPNTNRLSRDILPEVIRRLDPCRDYLPSSPYHSPEYERRRQGEEVQMPEQHLWGPRDDFKADFYLSSGSHFVSEIGYHGCPDPRSLEEMMDADSVWPWQNNDQWLTHCVRPKPQSESFNYRIELMAKQIAVLFEEIPDNLPDFALASQIVQAEAKKFFIEFFRAGKWRRTGILWWNLRDGWPIISDAVVDYYGRKKLAYEYIRRVQQNVCAIIGEPADASHPVLVVNDSDQPVEGELTLHDASSGDRILGASFAADANGKAHITTIPESKKTAMFLLDWKTSAGVSGRNHYLAGPRPFTLTQYRKWLQALAISTGIGPE